MSPTVSPTWVSSQRLEKRVPGRVKRVRNGESGDQGPVLLLAFVVQDLLASIHLLWASSCPPVKKGGQSRS